MRNGHTPFGYRIENGAAVIDEKEATQIRQIYAEYLSGRGYIDAAKAAGITMKHASVKRILQKRCYLGDGFYPAIIDQETYDAAEEERIRRAARLGRENRKKTAIREHKVMTEFCIKPAIRKLKDPYEQAEYLYSLIESEG